MRAILFLLLSAPAAAAIVRPVAPVATPVTPGQGLPLPAQNDIRLQERPLAGLSLPAQPFVAAAAVFEVERAVEAVHADLADIHASASADLPANDGRKRALRARLADAEAAVPGAAPEGGFPAVSAALKSLRAERDRVRRELRDILRSGVGDMDAAGERSLDSDRGVLKAQLSTALAMLNGKSGLRSRPALRNAALWTLDGALHSAVSLRAEVSYRELRASRARWLAEAAAAPAPGPRTEVVQRRWRNALTTLDSAGRDLRRGRREKGLEKIALLEAAYASREEGERAQWPRHEAIVRELAALRASPETFPQARERLGALIVRPKIAVRRRIVYKDEAAALRSRGHVGDSSDAEAAVVARQLALLERARGVVGIAVRSGRPIPAEERLRTAEDLAAMREWSERGSVLGKQAAGQALSQARTSLDSGDLPMVLRHVESAERALRARWAELNGLSRRMRRRG